MQQIKEETIESLTGSLRQLMEDWSSLDDIDKKIVRPILIYIIKELNKRLKELGIISDTFYS